MYKPLTDWWKKFLGADVEKVTISNKLDDDPLFILTSQYGFSATMAKANKAQAFGNQDAGYMAAKKTLELNPHHAIVKTLLEKVTDLEASNEGLAEGAEPAELDSATKDQAKLLWNMALLNSGFDIEDPSALTGPLSRVLHQGMGLDHESAIEEVEVEIDEEPEAEAQGDGEQAGEPDEELDLDAKEEQAEPEAAAHDEL